MKKIIKKYCAFIFLGAFLFPLVEKELHMLEHANDFHCTASDKHFHEQEHNCSLCDYTITDKFSSDITKIGYVISIKSIVFSSVVENVNSPSAFSDVPLRAPPVI